MDDLADTIDDLICSFENVTNTTMDTLAMLIFAWILVALFFLWLGKFLYNRFVLKQQSSSGAAAETAVTTVVKTTKVDSKVVVSSDKSSIVKSGATNSVAPVASVDSGAIVTEKVTKKSAVSPVSAVTPVKTGGYVPPTPPIRKRLSRKSPGPDLKKIHHKPAPKCTGPDNVSVKWVNDVFQWLYNDLVIVNELLCVWIQSLNDFTKKSVTEQGVGVEFVRVLPESPAPSLTNVFCECDTKDDVTITCDCEATYALQLKSFRQRGEKIETSHYRVNINRFRARLNIVSISEKLLADLKCDGWPEIKINLAAVGNIKNNLDETQLQDVISEIVVNALRNTQIHLNLSQYPTCPRLMRQPEVPAQVLPVHYDGMTGGTLFTSTPNHQSGISPSVNAGEKRLLVKVIGANSLKKINNIPVEPYCVVEMDEPFQKNQTSVKKGTDNPLWDEHFLYDLSSNTAELLFEVYDRANKTNRFLGLGIVGVDELLINPSQRQIISLQSRPYENDDVSGTLTVEFLFIEGADIPVIGGKAFKLKETIRTVSPTGQQLITTKTTYANDTSMTNGSADLTDSALKELERNKQGNNANKSTLIIHSVHRQPFERHTIKMEQQKDGTFQEVTTPEALEKSETQAGELQVTSNNTNTSIQSNTLPRDGERGRSRKKRDFFGTLRRRLGKSATRSKSAGRDEDGRMDDDPTLNRSISADRGRNGEEGESISRRSSLSEASGVSGASTRTYLNEASTLVLETLENGVKKRYLVPLSLAQRSRWRKKGVKLHIFNDHTFVAKHLAGGTVCQVCSKSIARRIGKQGYECRDCFIKCHKHCHVKIIDNCPTSTIHNMELSLLPVLSE